MNQIELNPLAEMLLTAHGETIAASRQHLDDHDAPMTMMAKVHLRLSIFQAAVSSDPRYRLHGDFSDFNRVEFTDLETGLVYRLKSDAARGIDQWANAPTLFDSMKYIVAPAVMLIHRFTPNGLDLAVAGTKALPGSSRLVVTGDPTPIGSWPYAADFGGALFDQAEEDWFDDLAGDEEEGQDDSE